MLNTLLCYTETQRIPDLPQGKNSCSLVHGAIPKARIWPKTSESQSEGGRTALVVLPGTPSTELTQGSCWTGLSFLLTSKVRKKLF